LTDDAISTTAAVTKAGPYTGKATSLTLKATPFLTQGAEATSFKWVLPDGVNVFEGADEVADELVGLKTWIGTETVLTIDLAGIGTGVTAIPLNVYAVNGAGTSSTVRALSLTAAIPATPSITSSTGTNFTDCVNTIYTAPLQQGATYSWTLPEGAAIVSDQDNVIEVDYSLTTLAIGATGQVTCTATNGTGNSIAKSYAAKRLACANPVRIAPEATTAEKFSAVASPNPAPEGKGFQVTSSNGKSFGVQVYDMLGRSIEQRQMSSEAQIGSNYAKGIYNVIVNQDAQVKTLRVIKR
jgi:hypothetical protein